MDISQNTTLLYQKKTAARNPNCPLWELTQHNLKGFKWIHIKIFSFLKVDAVPISLKEYKGFCQAKTFFGLHLWITSSAGSFSASLFWTD